MESLVARYKRLKRWPPRLSAEELERIKAEQRSDTDIIADLKKPIIRPTAPGARIGIPPKPPKRTPPTPRRAPPSATSGAGLSAATPRRESSDGAGGQAVTPSRPCPTCRIETQGEIAFGHCVGCGRHVGAATWAAWSRAVKTPCPGCSRAW